jgi:hypothetical protein
VSIGTKILIVITLGREKRNSNVSLLTTRYPLLPKEFIDILEDCSKEALRLIL